VSESVATFYSHYWHSRFLGPDEICHLSFFRYAVKQNKSLGWPHILDAGCGSGWLTHGLRDLGTITGIDLTIDVARRFYPRGIFRQVDVLTEVPTSAFDVVVSSEVLEHISDQARYVDKIAGWLRPHGMLLLTTPNKPKAEELFVAISRARKQSIENWLTQDELINLLMARFHVLVADTIVHYPLWVRKNVLANALYFAVYAYGRAFWIHDFFRPLDDCPYQNPTGLYHAVVAVKKGVEYV